MCVACRASFNMQEVAKRLTQRHASPTASCRIRFHRTSLLPCCPPWRSRWSSCSIGLLVAYVAAGAVAETEWTACGWQRIVVLSVQSRTRSSRWRMKVWRGGRIRDLFGGLLVLLWLGLFGVAVNRVNVVRVRSSLSIVVCRVVLLRVRRCVVLSIVVAIDVCYTSVASRSIDIAATHRRRGPSPTL